MNLAYDYILDENINLSSDYGYTGSNGSCRTK